MKPSQEPTRRTPCKYNGTGVCKLFPVDYASIDRRLRIRRRQFSRFYAAEWGAAPAPRGRINYKL